MYDILIKLFISILPVFVILEIVYSKDKDKEPKSFLIKLFVLGVLSTFVTLIFSFLLELFFPILNAESINESKNIVYVALYSFFSVALIEEFSKWIFTYFVGWNSKEFDQLYDSIIYAVFVSMGFATLENVFYVLLYGYETGLIRCFLSVPSHAFYGVFMGYYLGLAKISDINNKKKLKNKNFALSIIIPTFLHGLYDFCLLSESVLLIILDLVFVILLYIFGISKIKRFSNINGNLPEYDKADYTVNNIKDNTIISGNDNDSNNIN